MSPKSHHVLTPAALLLTLIACSLLSPTRTPTPTRLPSTVAPSETALPGSTPSPVPSATPSHVPAVTPTAEANLECNTNLVLEKLRSLVEYKEFSVHYNTFQGERTLVIWFVEPTLNPLAKGEAIADNLELAVVRAMALSQRLSFAEPCVKERFDVITAIEVDRDYNGWFSGKIPPFFLPQTAEPTDEELLTVKFEANYLREVETPKAGRQPAPAGSCSWPEARQKARVHFAASRPNIDFYLVIDEVGVNVWAQWDAPVTPLQGELASPLNVAMEVACLHPRLDWLWMFVVDEDGTITFLGRVPGNAVRSEDYATEVVNQMEVLFP